MSIDNEKAESLQHLLGENDKLKDQVEGLNSYVEQLIRENARLKNVLKKIADVSLDAQIIT